MNTKEYWDARYRNNGNSGYGSYDEQLTKKLGWLSDLPIQSIAEVGCGDLHFAGELLKKYKNITYAGQDISNVVIEINKTKSINTLLTTDINELPPSDLLLCIDVLFHVLEDDQYEKLLNALKNKWTKYLAITTYERDGEPHETGHHLKIRKFNPRFFGTPFIREVVEEDGQLYFYLFKKND